MKQSRLSSLRESVLNVAIGFGVSLVAQVVFLPALGVAISLQQNLVFAVIMTVISIGRSYLVRRLFEALQIRVPLSPAMLAVIAERRRQVDVEGWTAEHDDRHDVGELASAGSCYANCAGVNSAENAAPPSDWPWSPEWWKPRDFRRDLVRAGALILAELEKFDRSKRRRAT